MKTCVVLPTYNESRSIGNIVARIRHHNLEIIVIDDGSIDDTAGIARQHGATVIRNLKNQGKGACLIKGFNFTLKNGFDAVITMDGDGQHLPEDIPKFIKTAQDSPESFFIGNRMLKIHAMPFIRRLTNMFMSGFLSLIIKQGIPDTQCGFRLIKRGLLIQWKLKTFRYQTETEMLIRASKLKHKIISIPIETVYHGAKSQINPLIDTFRFIGFIIREFFQT